MVDLRTDYLGLELRSPLMASASPLTGDLDSLRRLEDAGADGFTIGTAVFDGTFRSGCDGLAPQIRAVLDCLG